MISSLEFIDGLNTQEKNMKNTSYRYWMIYVIAIVAAMGRTIVWL